jgi:hypothetical protein
MPESTPTNAKCVVRIDDRAAGVVERMPINTTAAAAAAAAAAASISRRHTFCQTFYAHCVFMCVPINTNCCILNFAFARQTVQRRTPSLARDSFKRRL